MGFLVVNNILCYSLSSFPQATDSTLLEKFKQQHQDNPFFVQTPVREPAFVIQHFAGKVKYQIKVKELSLKHFFSLCANIWSVVVKQNVYGGKTILNTVWDVPAL